MGKKGGYHFWAKRGLQFWAKRGLQFWEEVGFTFRKKSASLLGSDWVGICPKRGLPFKPKHVIKAGATENSPQRQCWQNWKPLLAQNGTPLLENLGTPLLENFDAPLFEFRLRGWCFGVCERCALGSAEGSGCPHVRAENRIALGQRMRFFAFTVRGNQCGKKCGFFLGHYVVAPARTPGQSRRPSCLNLGACATRRLRLGQLVCGADSEPGVPGSNPPCPI